LIGDHVIQLGGVKIEPLVPNRNIHAEFVTVKSMHFKSDDRHPTHEEFMGWILGKLREKFGLSGGVVEIGRKRKLQIARHPAATGYALGVYGIDTRDAYKMQLHGIGGRRHMGASLFMPGMLPTWVKSDSRLYKIRNERNRIAI
jgi:hypothetical protein